MAYWGVAYASRPNYNNVWASFDQKDLMQSVATSHDLSREAMRHVAHLTPKETALCNASQSRYPSRDIPFDFETSNRSYAETMRKVYDEFGQEDLNVRCLFTDALMMTALRKIFDTHTGRPIAGRSEESNLREHPGILHLYIHHMEISANPAVALPAADFLRPLCPDGAHLKHMPSHLDVLVGGYRRSIGSNLEAVKADEKFRVRSGGTGFYTFYRLHDYHSLIYAAMLAGQSRVALEAVEGMEASITDDLLRTKLPPLADWMEFFKSVRLHVYIRFDLWDAIKAYELPEDQELYCVATTFAHYAKGLAWAVSGHLDKADKERTLYQAAATHIPPSRKDFPNTISDELRIATAMLDGEIEYRRGNYSVAFKRLRDAIHYDDTLLYSEPWGWMQPTRHAFAALSLEQGNVEDALQAYVEDLGLDDSLTRAHQYPNNPWALHGYHECLVRPRRTDEARIIKKQLDFALAWADVPIRASCACRLDVLKAVTDGCCHK
ncbi:uncharacterized protein A1O5_06061 [Cladophialophora psammophila CBS 110553]|uniref:MalT-like TPR region domain-containing protein n=1 Tax=Cladophialophora psammophila CBS 110553 TaxID=1182543 RepID=W9WT04_9EURO|nr:uncharacterized protein A1O5_06061 [Cladophialophora psammophila CBS 110553]EXJ71068.1 hypothetical protein A1O5_06061 [Cladophialophora psammophila CBS 110553]